MTELVLLDDVGPGDNRQASISITPCCPRRSPTGRLNALRAVLSRIDYIGKDSSVATRSDPKIVGSSPEFFANA